MNSSYNLPTVHCIMMSTIDGKIGSGITGVDVVEDYLDIYRKIDDQVAGAVTKSGNAWLCGRVTTGLYFAETTNTPLPTPTKDIQTEDYIANHGSGRFFITIDTKGALRWKENFISFFPEHGNLHLIIIVNASTPKAYLSYLQEKGISYILDQNKNIDFTAVLTKLKTSFHIDTVLLEGGGKINGSFMHAGMVDDIHLLILPRVLNKKDAPSLFDGEDNPQATLTHYDLVESLPIDRGSLLVHYKKK